ncbi:hypothetical protein [Pseudoscardovia suis]|uniref:hypothetical protein n=1 Tax=Pseudoscardovia suis TaxID=987063 RepID=UPI0012FF201B|nr:hypothetical protein [Pseudoscardovia suis]
MMLLLLLVDTQLMVMLIPIRDESSDDGRMRAPDAGDRPSYAVSARRHILPYASARW